ncbi:hypothetical protein BBFGKLBO_00113 [Synechococcus sp. CBW1107]|nr:hypothetical protein BBFGKLBO_00113 [Synechococcus sp. CBW1107]
MLYGLTDLAPSVKERESSLQIRLNIGKDLAKQICQYRSQLGELIVVMMPIV